MSEPLSNVAVPSAAKSPAEDRPSITFQRADNGTIDARGVLDPYPGGVTFRVHQEWKADEHIVTFERDGLQVSFRASLFHLDCLAYSLAEYVKRCTEPRPEMQTPRPRINTEPHE